MSNNYDEYGYEDDTNYQKRTTLLKRLVIIILVVIAIIIVLVLIKGCNKNNDKPEEKVTTSYEKSLIEGAKKYFETNYEQYPKNVGECEEIELQALMDRNLVSMNDFSKCNTTTTYVQVCKLENNSYHYSPWLVCSDKKSEDEYGEERVGTLSDIVPDRTIVKFNFIPQHFKSGDTQYGEAYEAWKDEITLSSYKTVSSTTYYRYRDQLFTWNIINKYYYTSSGEKTKASDVKEYYPTTPNSNYSMKDNKAEGYKWYTTTSTKKYAVDSKGVKVFSHTALSGYPNPENGVCTEYQTRTVTGTNNKAPNHYYKCAKSKNSTYVIYQYNEKCGSSANPTYSYELENFYTCGYGDYNEIENNRVSSSSSKCNTYSEWKNSLTACDTSKDTCRKIEPFCVYNWYRVEGSSDRKYYPSGSASASGEKMYYTKAPVSGAIKDTNTKTTVYKWYRTTTKLSTDYSAVAPSSGATKTNDSKWTEWSEYSTKNPKVSDGRTRQIETRVKLKIQEIIGTSNTEWQDLSETYMSKDELVEFLKQKGYNVNSYEDIINNGELNLKIQMLVRNKKENK